MSGNDAKGSRATLSLSTGVFGQESFLPELKWCKHLGLESIETNPRHAEQLHESNRMREEALETMERLGIRLGSFHAWTMVDDLEDILPTVRVLKAGTIVVHCPPSRLDEDFSGMVEATKRLKDLCLDQGIILTIENASMQEFEPFVRFFEAVPGLPLTLDIRHAYKPELFGRTHRDFLDALGDRIANWHLAGIDPNRKPSVGDGTPPGNDAVDWDELVDDLVGIGYKGLLTVETTLPSRYSQEEHEELYGDIPPVSPEEDTVSRRLSRHSVDFFRKRFSVLLT